MRFIILISSIVVLHLLVCDGLGGNRVKHFLNNCSSNCQHKNGVCCKNNKHCCPKGSICDVQRLKCVSKSEEAHNILKLNMGSNLTCSDCPIESTCCSISEVEGTSFGCCSIQNAVCCQDGKSCCPNNTACDVTGRSCIRRASPISNAWATKTKTFIAGNGIACGNGTFKCPVETTCCKMASGRWGCCPMPYAVCCTDGIHCCPQNTVCDLSAARCLQSGQHDHAPTAAVQPIYNVFEKLEVKCQGSEARCPTNSTCCKMVTGQWGCCPMPHAVCCSDGAHCCPQNTRCNEQYSSCTKNDVRALQKSNAKLSWSKIWMVAPNDCS